MVLPSELRDVASPTVLLLQVSDISSQLTQSAEDCTDSQMTLTHVLIHVPLNELYQLCITCCSDTDLSQPGKTSAVATMAETKKSSRIRLKSVTILSTASSLSVCQMALVCVWVDVCV